MKLLFLLYLLKFYRTGHGEGEHSVTLAKVANKTWIGLHRDLKDTSRWLWVDGSYAIYTNWYDGEPNNSGGRENCVQLFRPPQWKWSDLNCNYRRSYICEISRK